MNNKEVKKEMVIGSVAGLFHIRRRPKSYKARDAAFQVGGNKGFYLASFPRPYPLTPQQAKVKRVAQECGIRPGISKADLQRAMKECVSAKMR